MGLQYLHSGVVLDGTAINHNGGTGGIVTSAGGKINASACQSVCVSQKKKKKIAEYIFLQFDLFTCNVFGRTDSAYGNALNNCVSMLAKSLSHHLGWEGARGDGINGDTLTAKSAGKVTAQMMDSSLGSRISIGLESRNLRHVKICQIRYALRPPSISK